MEIFYETTMRNGVDFPEIQAHETLDDAIEFAEKNGISEIFQNGGSYETFRKCSLCGGWFADSELDTNDLCERCQTAAHEHGF